MLTYTLSLLFDFAAQSSTVSELLFDMFSVELAPRGLGCGFSKIVFSALHCAHQPGGWAGGGRQAIG